MKLPFHWCCLTLAALLSLCSWPADAQSDRYIWAWVGVSALEFTGGQVGLKLGVHPTKHLAIVARGSSRLSLEQAGNFTYDSQGFAYGGSLRLYPFGPSRNNQLGEFMRRGFRASAPSGSSTAEIFLAGLYAGAGYEIRRVDMSVVPDANLNSPWPSFDYVSNDNSLSLELGYGISLSHFYLEFGYRLRLSQPSWEGPVDIFSEQTTSSTYTLSYLPAGAAQLTLGAAF